MSSFSRLAYNLSHYSTFLSFLLCLSVFNSWLGYLSRSPPPPTSTCSRSQPFSRLSPVLNLCILPLLTQYLLLFLPHMYSSYCPTLCIPLVRALRLSLLLYLIYLYLLCQFLYCLAFRNLSRLCLFLFCLSFYIVLFFVILFSVILFSYVLFSYVLFSVVLFSVFLFYVVLFSVVLFSVVLYSVVSLFLRSLFCCFLFLRSLFCFCLHQFLSSACISTHFCFL